jgi:MFS family permease
MSERYPPEVSEPRPLAHASLDVVRAAGRLARRAASVARGHVVTRVGGPARARVIVAFGAVLALSGADTATIGAAAPQLKNALHIGNTELGLLSSVTLLVGAMFVLPMGLLVDRIRRMPLLAVSVVLWSAASLASAFAGSYETLLITRLALGAVTATAGPAIASLTGDYFPANERGRVYAYILAGEVAGTAVGFIVGGLLASGISWRAAFVALALPGLVLARWVWHTVPEPLRGGQSHLAPGVADLDEALAAAASRAARSSAGMEDTMARSEAPTRAEELASAAARRKGVAPDRRYVLTEDPQRMSLGRAVRYVFAIRTNWMLIVGSSLGYFFFAGLQTFALLFMRGHYGIGQGTAELVLVGLVVAAVLGTLVSGRLSDALLRRGVLEVRMWVPAICYLGAAALLVPGLLTRNLGSALPFVLGGGALIAAANPPLDAARLDVMPAGLWGRAESVRSVVRSLAQALAPLLFGAISEGIAGIAPQQSPIGTHPGGVSSATATGLEFTFLLMLVSLAAAGVFLARARSTYPRDVATAAASRQVGGATA